MGCISSKPSRHQGYTSVSLMDGKGNIVGPTLLHVKKERIGMTKCRHIQATPKTVDAAVNTELSYSGSFTWGDSPPVDYVHPMHRSSSI